ncbi:MAG: hypothetical protein R2867_16095 [Caldilineaceae bacterium]
MTIAYLLALLLSPRILILYIWFIAFLALKFFSMTPSRRADRRVLFVAYLSLPIQFILILLGWRQAFVLFVPIWVFLVLPMVMVIIGETRTSCGRGVQSAGGLSQQSTVWAFWPICSSCRRRLIIRQVGLDFFSCTRHGAAKPHHTIYLWPALR